MDEYEEILGMQDEGEPNAVVQAEQEAPKQEPEAETPSTEPETESEETPEQEAERKRKTGSQRAKEKAARLEAENEMLRRMLLDKEQPKQTEQPKPVNDTKPRLEDFESHADWVEAVTDWKVDQKLKAREEAASQKTAQQTWEEKLKEGRSKFEDWDEALNDAASPSPLVAARLAKPSTPVEVVHYLATHPDEYAQINSLRDSDDVADAMAEIKARLKQPAARKKTETKAPPPITPVAPSGVVPKVSIHAGFEEF